MDDLYLVKLGGSVITDIDRAETAKKGEISRLLNELYEAQKQKGFKLIIGHGGGSFPHVPAKKYKVNEGLTKENTIGSIITHNSAQRLNSIVIETGLESGMPLFPFTASSFLAAREGKTLSVYTDAIEEALRRGFIPVVYGDVVIDNKKGVTIASTEMIFESLAGKMKPKVVMLATDVDGVFDKDPKVNSDAKLISRVDSANINSITELAGGSRKIDVTGGMKSKIYSLYMMVKEAGSKGYIVNATKPGLAKQILLGEVKSGFTLVES
jgi:isopentenyl phosphate kinase